MRRAWGLALPPRNRDRTAVSKSRIMQTENFAVVLAAGFAISSFADKFPGRRNGEFSNVLQARFPDQQGKFRSRAHAPGNVCFSIGRFGSSEVLGLTVQIPLLGRADELRCPAWVDRFTSAMSASCPLRPRSRPNRRRLGTSVSGQRHPY